MKEIDRRGRILLRLMIVSIFGTFDLLVLLTILFERPVTDRVEVYFLIAMMALFNIGFLCALFFACRSTPRVYFADEGVYIQPFFRKKLYLWGDIQQAVILRRVVRTRRLGRQIIYQFFLLTKDGSAWRPGDTEKTYRRRNRKHLLLIPLTNESKEYVKRHQVRVTFDESKGKRILWRLVK